MIAEVLDGLATNGTDKNGAVETAVRRKVAALCARFPVYSEA
jgi:glycine hydroxymethyltransferase